MADPVNILIGGEAGQGLVTIGQLLAKSLVRAGYHIVVTQSYMSRIRGGHNTFAIRTAKEPVFASCEPVDILIALNQETVDLHTQKLTADGLVVINENLAGAGSNGKTLSVPFKELGRARSENVIALGVAGSLLGLDQGVVQQAMDEFFGSKHPEASEHNLEALANGYSWASDKAVSFPKLAQVDDAPPRLFMNGNEAIAFGAMSAGLKFFSYYPMTPSTSIALALSAQAEKMSMVVEQAEDEIAAVNMALGASFAGAVSMTATSGGGFALMTEGVSLSAMTEVPLVFAVVQRPGPATGLPTRTAQADLELVLYAGHGEFPRAVYAPGTVEECFYLTRAALYLAEKVQGPVFILSDQFLADSYRAVERFEIENLAHIKTGCEVSQAGTPYNRYALTEDGVSPRLLPGFTKHLVVSDSDEHTTDGHLTEDLTAAQEMYDKRLRKTKIIMGEVVPPEYWGQEADPDILLVCWGSTKGAAIEAAEACGRQTGQKIGTLHFSQVWPLNPDQFISTLNNAKKVVMVEGNATSQFAGLVRKTTGFYIENSINRYDGLPLTAEFICGRLADI